MEIKKMKSNFDNLEIEIAISKPKGEAKGIIQIAHGMSEHKERYFDFMKFMSEKGYICVINDHRGHGNSVEKQSDLGYFYTEDKNAIVEDLYQVTEYIKKKNKDLDVFLFSHSMGTLVARNYLKEHDSEIKKLVLCGPPTYNSLAPLAIGIAKFLKVFQGDEVRSNFLNRLVFGRYNKGHKKPNEWICSNPEVVDEYNENEKTGFIFTINGFINLFKLMKSAFDKEDWNPNNTDLKILLIAGDEDPVIQSKKKFYELIEFLKDVGYTNVNSKLYENKRHEILNGVGKGEIYEGIAEFFENGGEE